FRPRPDLTTVAGGAANAAHAGFVTVLRGALPEDPSGAVLLRVLFDDGTALVKQLEPKLLRRLDCMTDSTELLRLYPSLRHEPCYPALLQAIERQLAGRVRAPTVIAIQPCKRLVVLNLPREPSNLRL